MDPKDKELIFIWTYPKDPKIISKVIRARLHTPYSHVGIASYIEELDEYRLYQASHGDVNSVLLRNFARKNNILYSCQINYTRDKWIKKFRFLESQTGKKYSVAGAIAATVPLFRRMKIGDDGDISFICSELAYRAYVVGYTDHHPAGALNSDYVDPLDFQRRLVKDGFKIVTGFRTHRPWSL